jgi:indolepyruvate ferredoxin oxidoreductase
VLNTYEAMPGTFTTKPDMQFPAQQIIDAVTQALDGGKPELVDATELATALLGDSIAANLFMLGYAWQKGWVPLSHDALMRAVELNGAAIEMNKAAFNWGRLAAHDIVQVRNAAGLPNPHLPSGAIALALPVRKLPSTQATQGGSVAASLDDATLSASLDEQIARRVAFLTDYQNAAYAQQYQALVDKARAAEQAKTPGFTTLTQAVARYAFKLMAYKDEYEVARLYTSGDFEQRVRDTFDGDYKLHFNLAPPLFARKDADGNLRKAEYGPWVFSAFKLLAKLRGLRGGALDVFGYTAERRMERQLIVDYRKTVDELLAGLDGDNHALAVDIASVPEHIRGYGHVKERHLADAMKRQHDLLAAWRNPVGSRVAA